MPAQRTQKKLIPSIEPQQVQKLETKIKSKKGKKKSLGTTEGRRQRTKNRQITNTWKGVLSKKKKKSEIDQFLGTSH